MSTRLVVKPTATRSSSGSTSKRALVDSAAMALCSGTFAPSPQSQRARGPVVTKSGRTPVQRTAVSGRGLRSSTRLTAANQHIENSGSSSPSVPPLPNGP